MKQSSINYIGAGLGWGAQHHETELGPQLLKDLNVLTGHWRRVLKPAISATTGKNLSYLQRLEQIRFFDEALANEVMACMQEKHFPIILGGDHTIAVGTWSGVVSHLQAAGQFGLIWIDAHMDAHTPQTSESHAIHGMPLAALLGYGEPGLVNLCEKGSKLKPNQVVLIGVRSFETGEAKLLKALNVKIFFMKDIQQQGFEKVFLQALEIVNTDTKGFGISIDMDAFDPTIAPGTGCPEPNGLGLPEVCQQLAKLRDNPQLKALEIVEYDPTKDVAYKTAYGIESLIKGLL